MASVIPKDRQLTIRPVQYRDLDELEKFSGDDLEAGVSCFPTAAQNQYEQIRRWYGPLKLLSLFPNPLRNFFSAHVAESNNQLCGLIQVSPFNRTRSTWRVEQVAVLPEALNSSNTADSAQLALASDIGSHLLRHCFEVIWEARTWLLEVNVNDKASLALYRQNGFQPLAHLTYWSISPEQLQEIAEHEPKLPNLLPVSNVDAQLLYQLDTASMPPLVRQVFDHQIQDFKTNLLGSLIESVRRWMNQTDITSGYVFEPQRKAAIGYFRLRLCRDGSKPHVARLTVHPAYTWLYPELLAQMARIVKDLPEQSLQLVSSDYQPEREEYLNQIGAHQAEHTLMMSRSVWHKLREAKPVSLDALQISEMLQGLQPARKPVPGRMSWRLPRSQAPNTAQPDAASAIPAEADPLPPRSDSSNRSDRPHPHSGQMPDFSQEGPSCG